MPDLDVAVDEYHNLRRPRNPDKTIEDTKHWLPILVTELYIKPPRELREALEEPIVYAIIRGIRSISYVAAGPADVLPPLSVVQATFSVIWVSTFKRAAPKAAAAVLAGAVEGAGGKLANNARFAYLSSSGRLTILERPRGIYDRLYNAAKKIASVLRRYALDDRLLKTVFELLDELDAYENVPIEAVAAVDPEAALALPLAKLLRKELEMLATEAVTAKDLSDIEAKIVEEYRRGLSPNEIAKRYGIAIGTVYNILRKYGIIVEGKNKRLKPEEVQRILELRKKGYSIDEIAKIVNRSKASVWRVLKRCSFL